MSEQPRASEPVKRSDLAPQVRFAGDEADFLWTETGIAIGFEKLHEERDGLKGEISVVRRGGAGGLIYFSTFNLTAGSTRDQLCRSLEKKTGLAEALWQDYLTVACWETTQQFREGTQTINLRHHKAKPLTYAVKGVMPLGDTSVIYGDGSSTKSLNAMAIAAAVTTGQQVGIYVPVVPAIACLYVDYETHEDEQKNRYDRILAGIGIDPATAPDFFYFQTFRTLMQEGARLRKEIDAIRRSAKQPDGHVVVIVDSIAWAVGGEVLPEVVIPFFNTLRSLGPRVSRLVVSHVSKSDAAKQKGAATPYGSVFVRNAARSAHEYVSTDAGGGGRRVGVFHRKTNSSSLEADLFLRVDFDDALDDEGRKGPITFSVDTDAKNDAGMALKSGSAKDRLMGALKSGSLDTVQAAREAGVSANIARARLGDMKAAGLVSSEPGPVDGSGRPSTVWRINPHRQDALPDMPPIEAYADDGPGEDFPF